MSTENLLIEDRLSQSVQTVKAKPHVDGIKGYEYASGRRNAQHMVPRSNRARIFAESASRHRTVRPEGATTSMAQGLDGVVGGGASLTSLKTTGTGRFEARFTFASHQFRVATGIPYCWENASRVRPLRWNCSTICSR